MEGVVLFTKSGAPLDHFARIQLPLTAAQNSDQEEPSTPFARLNSLLNQATQLATTQLPFVAFVAGSDLVQVACHKASVASVFKLLFRNQKELGVHFKDVKSHVILQPMAQQELEQACRRAVAAALVQRGWSQLGDSRLLGGSLLALADGAVDSITLEVQARQPDTVVLLLKPEVVRFRHPAVRDSAQVDLDQLQRQLREGFCTVLPDLKEGIICGLGPADPTTMERLQPAWASYGLPLPPIVPYLVHVRFDYDEDAPSFPYPPCCVLSRAGLDPTHTRLDSEPVQAVLARVRDDLAQSSFGFWGGSTLKLTGAKVWYPDGLPAHQAARQQALQAPGLVLQTARDMLKVAALASETLALGRDLDITSFSCDVASGETADRAATKPSKPHAHKGPALAAFLHKLEQEECAAMAAAAKKAAQAAPAPAPKAAPAHAPAGPPTAPKFRSTAPPAAAKGTAAGQKRTAAAKAGAAPKAKVPKAAKPSPAATAPVVAEGSAAGGVAAGAVPGPQAAVLLGGAAPAATAAPKAPRPKAPPLELEAVLQKVRTSFAAGKLSALTIPEMKLYLKSIKKPVGGKKAELEERVRQHLAAEA